MEYQYIFCKLGRHWILDAFAKLRKSIISFVMPVFPSLSPSLWNNSAPTERLFIKFYIWLFFENVLGIFNSHKNVTRITGTICDAQFMFMIISLLILLKTRNVSGNLFRKIKTHILSLVPFSRKSYQKWDNVEKYGTSRQATDNNMIRRMRLHAG
jgi:hypothetical protein